MEVRVKTEDDRSLADKAKETLHSTEGKIKELAHKIKDAVTGGIDAEIAEAEEDLAELEERERRNRIGEDFLDLDKEKATKKVAHLQKSHSNAVDEAVDDEAELEEEERRNKLRDQYLKEERLRAAEKVAHLKEKKQEKQEKKQMPWKMSWSDLEKCLKSLTLKLNEIDKNETLSKQLWRLISSCSALEKLSINYKYQPEKKHGDLHFSVVHLREALKLLEIKRFRCNLNRDVIDPTWLHAALGYNEHLRELILTSDDRNQMITFANEAMYPILSRLDSLKINLSYFDETTVFDVFPAVPTQYLMKTITYVHSMHRYVASASNFTFILKILLLLLQYIKLSNQMAKPIKTLLLCHWPKVLSERDHQYIKDFQMSEVIKKLSSMTQYRDLKTIQSGSWTRILFKNANLLVKARIYDNTRDTYQEFYGRAEDNAKDD